MDFHQTVLDFIGLSYEHRGTIREQLDRMEKQMSAISDAVAVLSTKLDALDVAIKKDKADAAAALAAAEAADVVTVQALGARIDALTAEVSAPAV